MTASLCWGRAATRKKETRVRVCDSAFFHVPAAVSFAFRALSSGLLIVHAARMLFVLLLLWRRIQSLWEWNW
jgi:hypothetical protein